MKTKKRTNTFKRPFNLLVMWLAGLMDDVLIWFYVWKGNADTPCGRVQSWARAKRNGRVFEIAVKAKKHFDT